MCVVSLGAGYGFLTVLRYRLWDCSGALVMGFTFPYLLRIVWIDLLFCRICAEGVLFFTFPHSHANASSCFSDARHQEVLVPLPLTQMKSISKQSHCGRWGNLAVTARHLAEAARSVGGCVRSITVSTEPGPPFPKGILCAHSDLLT